MIKIIPVSLVAALVAGMTAEEAMRRLSGIKCGPKSTSCPDQLSKAIAEYKASKTAETK